MQNVIYFFEYDSLLIAFNCNIDNTVTILL